MAIPGMTDKGVLPPGIHDATLQEVEQAFGTSNERRTDLFRKFSLFADLARQFGAFRHFYLDGSFVTDKLHPGDVDGVLTFDKSQLPRFMTHPDRAKIMDVKQVKITYEVHLFLAPEPPPEPDMVRFFQEMRTEEGLMRGLAPGARRGILRVAL